MSVCEHLIFIFFSEFLFRFIFQLVTCSVGSVHAQFEMDASNGRGNKEGLFRMIVFPTLVSSSRHARLWSNLFCLLMLTGMCVRLWLASGIHYLHRCGVLHLDIAARNILVCSSTRALRGGRVAEEDEEQHV